MENVIITFNENKAFNKAKDYFIEICGFHNEEERQRKIMTLGMDARKQILDSIHIRAIISSFDADIYRDHMIGIGETGFSCTAFSQIDHESVKKIYVYLLTVGECICREDENIMTQMFSDIWGTAYTDAARDLLERYIAEDVRKEFSSQLGCDVFLSESFGPGFYGMDVSQTKNFFQIMDAKAIGMKVKQSGLMLPLKSCAGIYFITTNDRHVQHPDCKDCQGSQLSCSFCRFRQKRVKRGNNESSIFA